MEVFLFLLGTILFLIMEYPMILLAIVLGFIALVAIAIVIAIKFPNFAGNHKRKGIYRRISKRRKSIRREKMFGSRNL